MALTWLTIANLRLAAHCDPRVPCSRQAIQKMVAAGQDGPRQ